MWEGVSVSEPIYRLRYVFFAQYPTWLSQTCLCMRFAHGVGAHISICTLCVRLSSVVSKIPCEIPIIDGIYLYLPEVCNITDP